MSFPIDAVRARFPSLAQGERVYFDAPGGTQVCGQAIARMVRHLEGGTANSGGAFATSRETDALADEAHAAMADLLGAEPGEIAFGANMTTLTLAVSRSLAREWRDGDELVVTRLDHDANVAPWLGVAADRGMTVRWLDFDPADGRLRLEELPSLLSERTRLVAVGGASNALGTVNDVAEVARIVRAHSSALVFVDAVQLVPHLAVDVRELGCDLLACSPYKFFGPHQGVLWGRADLMTELEAYKVRPASIDPPAHRFETGTPSFEGQAGVLGVVEYLEWLGEEVAPRNNGRRERILAAMRAAADYEKGLSRRLLGGLASVPGLKLWGPQGVDGRVPTFAFTINGHAPQAVAAHLAEWDVFAWSGHFYAVEVIARLGLEESGGLVRVGLCHYNTADEVDRLIEALHAL